MHVTFLCLIPKVLNPVGLKDFRSISSVGCVYKLLAKTLAKRLIKTLPAIISPSYGAFVQDRQILEGILIANELIDSRKMAFKEGAIFKIDLEKAYDHVDWKFVDYMLGRFGFGNRWRGLIKECISSTSFSVLVNGSPSQPATTSRGLRQGYPLSPFLFTTVAEA
eukprot:TRINITY_DN7332_c0_g2_i1.p1 TRINITY_DN7332_c0_g2~~TRINITY_DN7332_c0_g2_i1.p1  ORF type:complete len:165 (+),score=21.69 TRINITY_DN7332_c0_g2_i1:122-616(+)